MAKLTFNAILVICTGNICRSPIGERLLRRLLPAARVDSAGTCGLEGRTADSQATEIAAERGTLLEGHVARRLTPAMVRDYDLILAMEPGTYRAGHGYRTGGARQNDALWSLDGQKRDPGPLP